MGGRWEADGPDVLVEHHLLGKLHQGYVVVICQRVVILVSDDAFYAPPHRPLVGLTLNMETKQGFPLVSL